MGGLDETGEGRRIVLQGGARGAEFTLFKETMAEVRLYALTLPDEEALARVLAGPWAGQILADLGAEVAPERGIALRFLRLRGGLNSGC